MTDNNKPTPINYDKISPNILRKMHDIPDEYIKAWRDKDIKELENAHSKLTTTMIKNRHIDTVDTEYLESLLRHLMVYIQFKIEAGSDVDDRDLLI